MHEVRSRDERTRATRRAILQAALDRFAENGYAATSIEEIGRAAHVTGPAIYRHFSSKEELLVAAFEHAGRDRFAAEEASRSLAAPAALRLLLESFATFTFEVPQWTQLWLREAGRRHPPGFDRATAERSARYFARWVEVVSEIRPDLAPELVRELIWASWSVLNGATYQPSDLPDATRQATLVAIAHHALVGALGPQSAMT